MAGNGYFVTKDGRVIRAQAEPDPPQHPPGAEANDRPYAGGHNRQDVPRAVLRGMDMRRAAAFMVLVIISILAIMLAFAGIKSSGKWLFGERKTMNVISAESHQVNPHPVKPYLVNTHPANPQKPISVQTRSYPKARNPVADDGKSHKRAQPGDEVRTYNWDDRKQEVPVVGREPVVDYWSSIEKAKKAVEAQTREANRIVNELRNIEGSD